MKNIKILAISGSLRNASYNTMSLKALRLIARDSIDITIFNQMADLPLFNPDNETDINPPLISLKAMLADSDGLIIASPEYAHGISGVMKNALDWLVSGEEFIDKPVALINTSPRAHHAQDQLKEIVRTMSGKLIEDACITIPLLGKDIDQHEIVNNPEMSLILESCLNTFYKALVDDR